MLVFDLLLEHICPSASPIGLIKQLLNGAVKGVEDVVLMSDILREELVFIIFLHFKAFIRLEFGLK